MGWPPHPKGRVQDPRRPLTAFPSSVLPGTTPTSVQHSCLIGAPPPWGGGLLCCSLGAHRPPADAAEILMTRPRTHLRVRPEGLPDSDGRWLGMLPAPALHPPLPLRGGWRNLLASRGAGAGPSGPGAGPPPEGLLGFGGCEVWSSVDSRGPCSVPRASTRAKGQELPSSPRGLQEAGALSPGVCPTPVLRPAHRAPPPVTPIPQATSHTGAFAQEPQLVGDGHIPGLQVHE